MIGFGLTIGLAAIVLIWAVFNIVKLGDASDAILRENFQSIFAAENMIDCIERQDSASLLLLLGLPEQGLKQFRDNESHFLQWLGRAKDNITISGEARILDEIDADYVKYLMLITALRDALDESAQDSAETYQREIHPQFVKVRDACIELRQLNEQTMFAASNRATQTARNAVWSTVAVGVCAIACGLLFSSLLSQHLVQPLKQMVVASDEMAQGNYDVQVESRGSDELAQLANSFNMMAERLAVFHRMNVERIRAEQKRSEAVLRSIEDGVLVVDVNLNITNLNHTASEILNIDASQALGHHFLEAVRNDQLFDSLRDTVNDASETDASRQDEFLRIGSGSQAREYLVTTTPVFMDSRERYGAVLMMRDVTRLKQVDRMKSEFVMTASHELRTPLQSIGMSIELLREQTVDKLTEKETKLLLTASEEVQRLKSLVNELLDLSKIEAGKVEMDFAEVDVNVLLNQAVSLLQAQAEEKGIELNAQLDSKLPTAYADAGKIVWVLTNLIGNALRFVPRDGWVRLSAEQVGDWVHVKVSDNGKGIAKEDQARIFDKFVQIKDEHSVGGTGLGLAICREIIRAHQGTIWVDSQVNEGSAFTFTLPLSPIENEEP